MVTASQTCLGLSTFDKVGHAGEILRNMFDITLLIRLSLQVFMEAGHRKEGHVLSEDSEDCGPLAEVKVSLLDVATLKFPRMLFSFLRLRHRKTDLNWKSL